MRQYSGADLLNKDIKILMTFESSQHILWPKISATSAGLHLSWDALGMLLILVQLEVHELNGTSPKIRLGN